MKKFDLVLITTHQNGDNIYNLIDSISKNIKHIKILLIVVSQECKIDYCEKEDSDLLSIVFINELKMGLSKARNIALDYLKLKEISAEYIMFPDDDSSFDKVFFQNFSQILGSAKCYITPIFNQGSKDLYFGKPTFDGKIITPIDHQLIGSPNQIVLYDKWKDELLFDEKLGVGAIYGSSEDIDLFMTLSNKGAHFVFINSLYSYHPKKIAAYKNIALSKILKRFKSYSHGFAYVIFKYRLYNLIPEFLIRTFGAFIIFALKLQFKLALAYLLQFFIRINLLYDCYLKKNSLNFK